MVNSNLEEKEEQKKKEKKEKKEGGKKEVKKERNANKGERRQRKHQLQNEHKETLDFLTQRSSVVHRNSMRKKVSPRTNTNEKGRGEFANWTRKLSTPAYMRNIRKREKEFCSVISQIIEGFSLP